MKILTILLLLLPVLSSADKLIIGGFSEHYGTVTNQVNYALGYQKNNIEIAAYYNSYYENSIAFSVHDYKWHHNSNKIGFKYGLVTGYEGREVSYHGLSPIVQFIYSGNNYDLGFGAVSTLTLKVNI